MPPQPSPIDNAPISRVRWFHLIVLGICLAIGAGLRFHGITRQSLWLDEYWSVYFATARGQPGSSIFDAPTGVVIQPSPPVGFVGAPPWWKIWTGMSFSGWGPAYHILLRWWVDLFGDSDLAMRSLSTALDLASAILLFEFVRRTAGAWPAVFAAGMLCFSCLHIDQSQETRCYTTMAFFGLLACLALLRIEQDGATAGRLIVLGGAAAVTAVTHYFSAGALLGMGVYVLIRFRGRQLVYVLLTLLASVVVVAVAWGPYFLRSVQVIRDQSAYLNVGPAAGFTGVLRNALYIPQRQVLNPFMYLPAAAWALLIWTCILPIARLRHSPPILFWWLWVMGTMILLIVLDAGRQTQLLALARYAFIASPGMYALLASPLPWPKHGKLRLLAAPVLLGCTLCFAVDRAGVGGMDRPRFEQTARTITQLALPGDVIVFTPASQFAPQNTYMAIRHYLPDDSHPVVFLKDEPPTSATLASLRERGHFWMVGWDAPGETRKYFPGFTVDIDRPEGGFVSAWRVIAPASAATSMEPSPATRP